MANERSGPNKHITDTELLVAGYRVNPGRVPNDSVAYDGLTQLPNLRAWIYAGVAKAAPNQVWEDRYGWFLITDVLRRIDDRVVDNENKYLIVAKHLLACGGPYVNEYPVPGAFEHDAPVTLGDVRQIPQPTRRRTFEEDPELRRFFAARILGYRSNIFRRLDGHPNRAAHALLTALNSAITTDGYIASRIPEYAKRLRAEQTAREEATSSQAAAQLTPEVVPSELGQLQIKSPATRVSWLRRVIYLHPIRVASALLVVIGLSLSSVAIFYYREKPTPAPSTPSPLAGATTVTEPAPQQTIAPSSTPQSGPTVLDHACATPNPSDQQLPEYELCVVHWCQGIVIRPDGSVDESRIQIKVRPRIVNNSATPLDVTIWKVAALRLLVASSDLPGSWKPPNSTAEQGDIPYLVGPLRGQRYWAVAPNLPHDIDEPDEAHRGVPTGFATFWDESSIAPSAVYPPPIPRDANGYAIRGPDGRFNQDGDLVFQIPAKNDTNGAGWYGLALIDRADPTKVLAVAWYPEQWGKRMDSNEF